MQTYEAPLCDMRFVLHELHGDTRITDLPGCADFTPELIDSILAEAGKVAEEVLLPLNARADKEGCHYENGVVRTRPTPKSRSRRHDEQQDGNPCPS
jgi:Acyl-CoA dehydrogenase N terminal